MNDGTDPGSGPDDKKDKDKDDSDNQSGTDPSVHLINTAPLQNQGTIDEPVTSGSDGPGGPI
jgi:hypothetical protein